jgi:hypothetical protein
VTLSDGFRCGGDDQIQVVEVYEKGEEEGEGEEEEKKRRGEEEKRRRAATGDRRYGRKNPAFVGRG